MNSIFLSVMDWTLFFGRFHPVLVHLPIGFLLIAALLEIGRRTGKIDVSQATVTFILLWSAIGATLACIAGYMLSLGGGYDDTLLRNHKYQGIGLAVCAWVAWLVKSHRFGSGIPTRFYLPAFGLSVVLTLTAGHDGGSLTHGEEYLTQNVPEPFRSLAGIAPQKETIKEIKPIANVEQAIVYHDIVQPILEMHCTQCHNATKKKGGLRMDKLDLLIKGGDDGLAFITGKGSASAMIKRCLLPEEDDKHMPPKGKPQLTTDQIALLTWWIDHGASADKKVADLKVTDQIRPALAALTSRKSATSDQTTSAESPVLSVKVAAPNEKAIQILQKVNLMVTLLAHDKNIIEVSAVNAGSFNDSQIGLLTPLADQIVWLKLGSTKISDASLTEISKFKNLNKLHLEYTSVTDSGLANLKNLPYLEYINLIGTHITDEGLKKIAALKSIRSIYVWQSSVTDEAVDGLKKQYPNLTINNGLKPTDVAQFLNTEEKSK